MGDTRWLGTIDAHARKWVAPSPRSVNFYADAVVIAHGPKGVHLQRFVAGAEAGLTGESVMQSGHQVDTVKLGEDLRALAATIGTEMLEQARTTTAQELAHTNPNNVLIGMDELEGIHVKGMHPHARLRISRTNGKAITLYMGARPPAFKQRLDVLHTILGERLTFEKIQYRP